jgi:hypothetical protein
MSVYVSVDLNGLNSILSGSSLERARYVLADQALSDMDKFVPLKSKKLVKSGHLDNNYNIVYDTPYAKAQFYGMIHGHPVKHYTQTEGRQPTKRWDLKAAELYGDEWANKVKKSLLEGK